MIRLQFPERAFLLTMLAGCLSLWCFIEVADEVMEGDSHALDHAILSAMRQPGDRAVPIGPAWMKEVTRDITALGGGTIISLVTLVVLGFLWLRNAGWAEAATRRNTANISLRDFVATVPPGRDDWGWSVNRWFQSLRSFHHRLCSIVPPGQDTRDDGCRPAGWPGVGE